MSSDRQILDRRPLRYFGQTAGYGHARCPSNPRVADHPRIPYPPICQGFLSLLSPLTFRYRPDMVAFCILFLHPTSILPTVAGIYALLDIYTPLIQRFVDLTGRVWGVLDDPNESQRERENWCEEGANVRMRAVLQSVVGLGDPRFGAKVNRERGEEWARSVGRLSDGRPR